MPYDPLDAVFLLKSKGGFADVGLLTPTVGVSKEIAVIFDREGALTTIGNTVLQNPKPSCVIMSKDLPAAENETAATLIIGGVTYKITDPLVDADGTTTLQLTKD